VNIIYIFMDEKTRTLPLSKSEGNGYVGAKCKGKVVTVLFFNRVLRHEGLLGSGDIAALIL
jgi:hypothetical protein